MLPLEVGDKCDQCGLPAKYEIEPQCRACFSPTGDNAPNVQLAKNQETLFIERYENVLNEAIKKRLKTVFTSAERLGRKTVPVASIPLGFADTFFFMNRDLYVSYHDQVRAGLRAPASLDNDRMRGMVDIFMYGSYGPQIVFAVLSTDGTGLESYGEVHMELHENTIDHRATILEQNSFKFFELHIDNYTRKKEFPAGSLVVWQNRGKLVAVKCFPSLVSLMDDNQLNQLIKSEEGDRATDEFLEVHIYGIFNNQAVKSVKLSDKPLRKQDQTIREALQKQLEQLNINWQIV